MTAALLAAMKFNLLSDAQLQFARWLESNGIHLSHALNVAGPIVEHDIVVFPGATFDFAAPGSADSVRAVVHVARDVDDETPIDLVAWQPQNPARIFRHLGEAVMLGASQLDNPASYFKGQVLRVHRTALDWLAAGCRGVVILDPKEFVVRLSALPARPGGYALAAADITHAKLLRASIGSVDCVRLLVSLEAAA